MTPQTYAAKNDPTHPLATSQFSQITPSSYDLINECGDWYGEETLDVESVHTTAPGAHILYVGARDCNNGLLDSLRNVVDGHLASVVSNSWGDNAGDLLDSTSTKNAYDNVLIFAAGTGISVLFSSGDDGDNSAPSAPRRPTTRRRAVAAADGAPRCQIGRTAGQRLAEYGWSTARSFLCTTTEIATVGQPGCTEATLNKWLPLTQDGGSGGGTSYSYPQPYYQSGVVPTLLATRNSPIVGPQPMRVVPDISMLADPGTGFLVGQTQQFPNGVYYDQYRIGGTSVASPMFAGVLADADGTVDAPVPLGSVNPTLYKLYQTTPSAIYDVVPGPRDGPEPGGLRQLDRCVRRVSLLHPHHRLPGP